MTGEPWNARRPGPWIALDCGLFRHRKLEGIAPKSALLWIAALCHCGDELTDGHVSTAAMRRLLVEVRASSRNVGELRAAGLLEGDGPWEIAGYLDWNPPRDHVQAKRDAGAARVRAHRARRRQDAELAAELAAELEGDSNGSGNALGNAPREVEVEEEGVSSKGSTSTTGSSSSAPPATLEEMTTQDVSSLAASAAQLLDRLRRSSSP